MSAQNHSNSDTHWFLENPTDLESKYDRNEISENQKSQGNSELEHWRQEYAASKTNEGYQNTKQMRPERINWDDTDSKPGNNPEEIKNKIDFQSSGGSVQSVPTNNNPVRITLKSDELDKPTIDHEISNINITEKQSNPEILITLNDEIEQSLNKDNENNINTENSMDNAKQSTIYVLLKDKNGAIGKTGNTDSNTVTCTEVGSTVINVNDFLSPDNQLSGTESISTAVSYSPSGQVADGSPQQVELVITIKDERDKPKGSTFNQFSEERDIPIKLEKTFDSNVAYSTHSSSNYMNSWESISDSRRQGRGVEGTGESEYSEKRDSWVRESDGARCQRTVVTTPRGQKVHTHCYKDGGPRRTRDQRRVQDWSASVNSFFEDLDDEISGFFNQVNRFLFY